MGAIAVMNLVPVRYLSTTTIFVGALIAGFAAGVTINDFSAVVVVPVVSSISLGVIDWIQTGENLYGSISGLIAIAIVIVPATLASLGGWIMRQLIPVYLR